MNRTFLQATLNAALRLDADLRIQNSMYKGKATDGRDSGADIDAVLSATSGVVQV